MESARQDKELIDATRPFAVESKLRSWWSLASTLALICATLGLAACAHQLLTGWAGWPVRCLASLVSGLLIVRMFILYHDFQHGAILRGSRPARAIFWVYGMLIMTPPKVWRETHNYHHANTAKIIGSHVGSYAMVTTGIWAKMSPGDRRMYKIIRHPMTIVAGYFTLFMFGMGVSPFLRAPKKHWQSIVAVAVNLLLSAFVVWRFDFVTFGLAMWLPLAISMSVGGYLFYAQHNFPDIHIQPRESWSFTRAAVDSSSYMEMGPVGRFVCGNIGFHHVHHLNSMIPFYRLPEAMRAIPELAQPHKTTWSPRDVIACFRLKLWDTEQSKMVGYPES